MVFAFVIHFFILWSAMACVRSPGRQRKHALFIAVGIAAGAVVGAFSIDREIRVGMPYEQLQARIDQAWHVDRSSAWGIKLSHNMSPRLIELLPRQEMAMGIGADPDSGRNRELRMLVVTGAWNGPETIAKTNSNPWPYRSEFRLPWWSMKSIPRCWALAIIGSVLVSSRERRAMGLRMEWIGGVAIAVGVMLTAALTYVH